MDEEKKYGLSRNIAGYGDAEFSLYLRRSFAHSMGYSQAMLERPVVGIVDTGSGYNNCHRTVPELIEAVQPRRARGGRAAARLPHGLAVRAVAVPDLDALPQPRGPRHRGDAVRPADGRGGAGGRLRQDGAGAAHGGGLGAICRWSGW